jgi:hypothetical protein
MNGGVFHALEVVSEEELRACCAGFRYFGLDEAAGLLEAASTEEWTEQSEVRCNAAYAKLVDDAILGASFRTHFSRCREKYAP